MGQAGIGAMLHYLGGGSKHDPKEYYGQTILAADIADDKLSLKLDGGKTIEIWDNGQSCCENRYMRTDDDLSSLVGNTLVRIEAKDGPDIGDNDYDVHEQVFVEVGTDKGFITIANHNEHNGYYGGFGLTITESDEQR
jgi:hypothetical protein